MSFPLPSPPVTPATERCRLIRNQGVMRSPHSGFTTIQDNFSEWEFVLTFPPQTRIGARTFLAWFDSLQGATGTFTYAPAGYGKPVTGKTLHSTGFAYATSVVVAGWSNNASTGLSAGDLFTLDGKLHRITVVPANADGTGKATISFEPGLRANVAAATSTNFASPTIILRVMGSQDDGGGGSSRDPDAVYLDAITAREAR